MARGFLIFLNLVVLLIYMALFIFMEPLLAMAGQHISITPAIETAAGYFLLIVIGFCMGNLTQIFTRTQYTKTRWDIRGFVLLSMIPVLFLLAINLGPTVAVIVQLPFIRESPAESLYYLLSTQYIWILWIGFNLGASIKFAQYYKPKRARQQAKAK